MSKLIKVRQYELRFGNNDIGLWEGMASVAACLLMESIWWGVLVAGVAIAISRITLVITDTEVESEEKKP